MYLLIPLIQTKQLSLKMIYSVKRDFTYVELDTPNVNLPILQNIMIKVNLLICLFSAKAAFFSRCVFE